MSRRRISSRRSEPAQNNGRAPYVVSSLYPVVELQSGEVRIIDASFEVDEEDRPFMPLYDRGHQLLPRKGRWSFDPNCYRDHLGPSIALLQNAGPATGAEDMLRALAILGHTPDPAAIRALSEFASSRHELAPVARMALSECSSLFISLKQPAKAS